MLRQQLKAKRIHRLARSRPGAAADMRKIDLTNLRLATSETAHDINRRIALDIIRCHQPMSRADLGADPACSAAPCPRSTDLAHWRGVGH